MTEAEKKEVQRELLQTIFDIDIDDAVKLTHPKNGQWDATPRNTAMSIAILMANKLNVKLKHGVQ